MRKFIINVNGNSYEVEVEEVGIDSAGDAGFKPLLKSESKKRVQKAKTSQMDAKEELKESKTEEVLASGDQETVDAPMPGSIYKIMVNVGDNVNEGEVVLILEAMKMENEILAPISGKVVAVNTSEGSVVNTGDKLVVLE